MLHPWPSGSALSCCRRSSDFQAIGLHLGHQALECQQDPELPHPGTWGWFWSSYLTSICLIPCLHVCFQSSMAPGPPLPLLSGLCCFHLLSFNCISLGLQRGRLFSLKLCNLFSVISQSCVLILYHLFPSCASSPLWSPFWLFLHMCIVKGYALCYLSVLPSMGWTLGGDCKASFLPPQMPGVTVKLPFLS